MDNEVIREFPISVYGNFERYNDTISKARCRIFYKYGNRNGSYITDEFADKLITTLPYTPVKGIYSSSSTDYTDHGAARDLGRIYGIVPENPNFAWEKHVDEDGIEREYACVDVYIYTALYGEANAIAGKPQSMELYPPSIKGTWKVIEGKKQFVFDDACFLGLQVLGDNTEPCFEGAGFFSLFDDLDKIAAKIEELNATYRKLENGGKEQVENSFFKLSDGQKYEALWTLLNPHFNEADGFVVTYAICDVYDAYAVCRNYENGDFERIYYSKDDNLDTLEITGKEKCYMIDVNEEERQLLLNAKKRCGCYEALVEAADKYEATEQEFNAKVAELDNLANQVDELKDAVETYKNNAEDIDKLNAQIDELNTAAERFSIEKESLSQKIMECESANATLLTDNEELKNQILSATDNFNKLENEAKELRNFKYETEKAQKMEIIDRYAEKLDAAVLDELRENVDNYSAYELDKELAYKLVNANPNIFTKAATSYKVPKTEEHNEGGIADILARYRK